MRRLLLCVPMMALLLSACGGGRGKEADQLALLARGTYLDMAGCTLEASVTADYGRRVYQYELSARAEGE